MYELLKELKERLLQIAIVGLKSIPEDFRLKKLQEKLKVLKDKAPVLERIYELVTKLLEGQDVASHYLELNYLVDAILKTQGTSKIEGAEKEVEVYNHQRLKELTYQQVQNVRTLLQGRTTGKWAKLKKLYDKGTIIDWRLIEDYIANMEDTYEYYEYEPIWVTTRRETFTIGTIIKEYGEDIVPILIECFEGFKPIAQANTIRTLCEMGASKYNEYYIRWVQDSKVEATIEAALMALGCSTENEIFLIEYKTRKKKLHESRLIALTGIGTQTALEEVKKHCLKDPYLFLTILKKVELLTEDELVELTLNTADCINEEEQVERTGIYISAYHDLFRQLIDCLEEYNTNKVLDVIKQIIDIKKEGSLECFEARIRTRIISEALYNSKHPERIALLAELKDSYRGYYLAYSFLAALRCWDSKKVYEEFAPIMTKKYATNEYNVERILEQLATTENGLIYLGAVGQKRVKAFEVKWDRRWLEYAKEQKRTKLIPFFELVCMNEEEKALLKERYMEELQVLKEKHTTDEGYYYNSEVKNAEKHKEKIKMLIKGLILTGASEVAIHHMSYFIFFLNNLELIYSNYLKEEHLPQLNQFEEELVTLPLNRQEKARQSIKRIRSAIVAKS